MQAELTASRWAIAPAPSYAAGALLSEGATPRPPVQAPRPTVSVVLCAFTQDRWHDLSRAVHSLHWQLEPPREVILVVDHCPELLMQAARELTGVSVVANAHTQGLSGARNTGVEMATSDVVAFLDDDAAADTAWLARLADHYRDPNVLGVGGLVRPDWDVARPVWLPPELDWVVGCSYRGLPEQAGKVRNFIGANMSFRRSVLTEVGGFATSLGRVGTVPLGCEETELCLRVAKRHPDGVLLYDPAASVAHRVRAQRTTWRYLRARCYAEGLSKAGVARMAGSGRALASERAYVGRAAGGVLARTPAALARHRLAGLGAATAMVTALVWTATGYAAGRSGLTRLLPLLAGLWAPAKGRPLLPWAGLGASAALWGAALVTTPASRVPSAGFGLAGALPHTFWAALAVLLVSFCLTVARWPRRWLLGGLHLLLLVAVLHATPALIYETLRYSWAWKHVGVTDYILHHGVDFRLGGELGAYQGWPGFFTLNAFLTSGSGLHSALSYANWALVVNDLLWLGPILLIARAFSRDPRFVWTAALLFELGNWVGQDYFSPQAFAYFLYLVVIAVSLRWLGHPAYAPPMSRAGRYVLTASMLPLMSVMASSHQLTPFMLAAALILLALTGHLRPRVVPVLLVVAATAAWLAYGAWPWLSANSYEIFQGLGVPWANTSAHLVGGGGTTPPDQNLVDSAARLLSLACGGLALIGFCRFYRHHGKAGRRSWQRIAVLGIASLPSAAASSYGGEIIFRVFLFALPYCAIAGAAAFFPHEATTEPGATGPAATASPQAPVLGRRRGRPAWATAMLLITALALAGGYSLANFGKEAMDYFTPDEVSASAWLYRTAPAGAQILAVNSNFPWGYTHYNAYTYTFMDSPVAVGTRVLRDPVGALVSLLGPGRSPASYLVLTKSQEAEAELTPEWPPGAYTRVWRDVAASGEFRVVFSNADAAVYQVVTAPTSAAPTSAAAPAATAGTAAAPAMGAPSVLRGPLVRRAAPQRRGAALWEAR